MAAFISLFAMMLMLLLAWKGRVLRRTGLRHNIVQTEEGQRVAMLNPDSPSSGLDS